MNWTNFLIICIFFFSVFGLDSPLGLFPPGMDHGKLYSPLMEMSDPRGMHDQTPFLKKKSKYYTILYEFSIPRKTIQKNLHEINT